MTDMLLALPFAWQVVLVAALAAVMSTAILHLLLSTGWAWRLATDIPNSRSLHSRPTPRIGGWGIVPVVVVLILGLAPHLALIALAAAALAALSQVDDRRGLPARVRFAAHLGAVAVLLVVFPAAALWWLVAIGFLMVWLINLYNFMDGADGLAGGMALFGFGAYAAASLVVVQGGAVDLALASAAIAGAAAGFLLFNFHPARLFLGDAGSIPLGFLAGALGYWGWRKVVWPIWFPAMVFAPFIADASVTLLRRLLRGEKFWQAHREHYYQRMIRLGINHRQTALCWYAAMLVGIIVALRALTCSPLIQWSLFVGWYCVIACTGLIIDLRWRRVLYNANDNF